MEVCYVSRHWHCAGSKFGFADQRPALEWKHCNWIRNYRGIGTRQLHKRPLTHQISSCNHIHRCMVSSMMQRGNSTIRHLFLLSRLLPVYRISLPPSSSRHLSSDLPYTVIHTAERFFEGVHFYAHLPWWAVIVCCTVTLRSIITLPLAVYQNKILAKRELLAPTLKEYKEAVLHNVTIKCRRENVSHKIANRRVMKEVQKSYLIFH